MARRRRLPSVLAAVLAAVLTAGATGRAVDQHDPLRGIKGDDDRIQVDARTYPWSAIGRLTKGDGSLCSAVMIGPATALTAAHCVWNDRTATWMPPQAVFLTLGWERGDWAAASQVTHIETDSAFAGPSVRGLSDMAADWAVLHLAAPVGNSTGWLGVAGLDSLSYGVLAAQAPVVMQAGYSMDRRHVLTGHIGCHIQGWVAEGVVAHDCDATRGDSGSPLFALIDGEFKVLGTHVSSFNTEQGVFGAAIASGNLPPTAGGSAGRTPSDQALMRVLLKGT
ncbi:MAG: trypsin-like serine protease [Rhodospirillaceae bacterium]